MCSAGRWTNGCRSACSTRGWMPASTSSTPPTCIRPGCRAMWAASPKRSSASGCGKAGKRHQVVLATKVGKPMGEGKQGLSPAYIRQAVDASLKRLQTDHIDLYQSHDDDAATPLDDTLGAFAELIQAGKVRAIGASNYSAPRLAEALDVSRAPGPAALRKPAAALQPLRPRRVRRRAGAAVRGARSWAWSTSTRWRPAS